MKVSMNWLKDYVTLKVPTASVAERLTLAGLEVEGIEKKPEFDDQVLSLEITSNRPDWLSHWGVAREIHAVLGGSLRAPENRNPQPSPLKTGFFVDVRASDLCPYYTATLLEGVEFGESPEFMRKRLGAVGVRPINLVVDVTNYVLLELGQPLHAFDWDRLNQEQIVIRRGKPKEKIVAINGTEYSLEPHDLVIADKEHPIAVAGVMGGSESEVSSRTKNILLESAYFAPAPVRRTSKRLGLVSESSYRFERGVDPQGVDLGRERAIYLIRKYAQSVRRISQVFKGGKPPLRKRVIRFPLSEVKRIVGTEVPREKAVSGLRSLGLGVQHPKGRFWTVGIPSHRQDLARPIDLVEEIIRLHGYEKIPGTLPSIVPTYRGEGKGFKLESQLRELAVGFGLSEVVTYSLINEGTLSRLGWQFPKATRIINPQNKELTLMRPSFFPSFLEVIQRNLFHGTGDIRIFEIASLYELEEKGRLPQERRALGMALAGFEGPHWIKKGRAHQLFDMKGLWEGFFGELRIEDYRFALARHSLLQEGSTFTIEVGDRAIGVFGALERKIAEHYDIEVETFLGEIRLEMLSLSESRQRIFRPLPKYPRAERDLALIVEESVSAEELRQVMRNCHPHWIKRVEVFDLYRGTPIPRGKKSIAFRIEYRADDHTLTTEEINKIHRLLIEKLKQKFQLEVRGSLQG